MPSMNYKSLKLRNISYLANRGEGHDQSFDTWGKVLMYLYCFISLIFIFYGLHTSIFNKSVGTGYAGAINFLGRTCHVQNWPTTYQSK